jgi:transposase
MIPRFIDGGPACRRGSHHHTGRIIVTHVVLGGDMARSDPVEDPKVSALRAVRCLNPHPEAVTDERFTSSDFFDPRDAVQVQYEMVRAVGTGDMSVTAAAAAFGYSRPAYYAAATALAQSGLDGLAAAKPGPRRGHKLTDDILAWADQHLSADPATRPGGLCDTIWQTFGVRVHPRTIERGLARYRHQSKSR